MSEEFNLNTNDEITKPVVLKRSQSRRNDDSKQSKEKSIPKGPKQEKRPFTQSKQKNKNETQTKRKNEEFKVKVRGLEDFKNIFTEKDGFKHLSFGRKMEGRQYSISEKEMLDILKGI